MASRGFLTRVFEDARHVARGLLAAGLVPTNLEPFARKFAAAGGYDAARNSRNRNDWTRTNTGPNTTVIAAGPALRSRARDLVRNNPHASRAINVLARSMVGTGILPRAISDTGSRRSDRLQKQADAAWRAWCKAGVADLEGQHTLYALTWVIAVAWLRDGEVFLRRRWDPKAFPVPARVELLEADMLDEAKSYNVGAGGRIVQGIELDANGRRVAYHFRTVHPGESSFGLSGIGFGYDSVRVDAVDVIHLFLPLRPRQLRGLPFMAPVMITIRDLGDFEGYELIRKKTETLVAAFVTPPAIESAFPALQTDSQGKEIALVPSVLNSNNELVGDLRPGAVLTVENGGDVRFNTPQIAANYDTYKKAMLQSIAVGVDMTYEDLTGDLSSVNYSSYRAGRIQFNAHIDALQWLFFVPVVMDRLWDWCQEAAYLTSQVGKPMVPVEWATPKRLSVDPLKDAQADQAEIRAGLALREDKQAERGYDPADFADRKKAEDELADENKSVYDSDPRKTSAGGQPAQQAAPLARPPSDNGQGTA